MRFAAVPSASPPCAALITPVPNFCAVKKAVCNPPQYGITNPNADEDFTPPPRPPCFGERAAECEADRSAAVGAQEGAADKDADEDAAAPEAAAAERVANQSAAEGAQEGAADKDADEDAAAAEAADAERAPAAYEGAAAEETRIAPDGHAYTKLEFEEFFGGLNEWNIANKMSTTKKGHRKRNRIAPSPLASRGVMHDLHLARIMAGQDPGDGADDEPEDDVDMSGGGGLGRCQFIHHEAHMPMPRPITVTIGKPGKGSKKGRLIAKRVGAAAKKAEAADERQAKAEERRVRADAKEAEKAAKANAKEAEKAAKAAAKEEERQVRANAKEAEKAAKAAKAAGREGAAAKGAEQAAKVTSKQKQEKAAKAAGREGAAAEGAEQAAKVVSKKTEEKAAKAAASAADEAKNVICADCFDVFTAEEMVTHGSFFVCKSQEECYSRVCSRGRGSKRQCRRT